MLSLASVTMSRVSADMYWLMLGTSAGTMHVLADSTLL